MPLELGNRAKTTLSQHNSQQITLAEQNITETLTEENNSTFTTKGAISVVGVIGLLIVLRNLFKKKPDTEGEGTPPYTDDRPDGGGAPKKKGSSTDDNDKKKEKNHENEEPVDYDDQSPNNGEKQNDDEQDQYKTPKKPSSSSTNTKSGNIYHGRTRSSSEKKKGSTDANDDLEEILSLETLDQHDNFKNSKVIEYSGYALAGAAISYAVYSTDLETLGSTLIGLSETSHNILDGVYLTAF